MIFPVLEIHVITCQCISLLSKAMITRMLVVMLVAMLAATIVGQAHVLRFPLDWRSVFSHTIVVDELKMHFSFVREMFRKELTPIGKRLEILEDVCLIRNKFDMQAPLRNAKKNTVEVKLAVDSLQQKLARIEDKRRQRATGCTPA